MKIKIGKKNMVDDIIIKQNIRDAQRQPSRSYLHSSYAYLMSCSAHNKTDLRSNPEESKKYLKVSTYLGCNG